MTGKTYTVKSTPGGFVISYNGKKLETPAGVALVVPTQSLAEAIVVEKPLNRRVDFKTMPLLQLAVTAIDVVKPTRDEIINRIVAYAGSEMLCHRAEHPPALVQEQEKIWQPLLDWCAGRFHAPLRNGTGIMPIAQPPESIAALRKIVEAYDVFRLTGLSTAVAASGSLVLGLALEVAHINGEQAGHAAELDAEHQMKDWGDDPEIQVRIESTRRELALCERWVTLLRK